MASARCAAVRCPSRETRTTSSAQHDRLVEAAREVERQREAAPAKRREASGAGTLGGVMFSPVLFEYVNTTAAAFGPMPDQRTLDEYEQEVAEWCREVPGRRAEVPPGTVHPGRLWRDPTPSGEPRQS